MYLYGALNVLLCKNDVNVWEYGANVFFVCIIGFKCICMVLLSKFKGNNVINVCEYGANVGCRCNFKCTVKGLIQFRDLMCAIGVLKRFFCRNNSKKIRGYDEYFVLFRCFYVFYE